MGLFTRIQAWRTGSWEPEEPSWLKPGMKASDVLAGALEFWGKDGERWVRGNMGMKRLNGCFYGGLSAAAFGDADAALRPIGVYGSTHSLCNEVAFHNATQFINDELEAQGRIRSLITFNDRDATGFTDVRKVACGALKRALAAEAKEAEKEG